MVAVPGDTSVADLLPGEEVIVYEVIVAPPSLLGAETVTSAVPTLGTAKPILGASGTTAFAMYVKLEGFAKPLLFVGVKVILPEASGVIVNVCAADVCANVRITGVKPVEPAPVGVRVIVPS